MEFDWEIGKRKCEYIEKLEYLHYNAIITTTHQQACMTNQVRYAVVSLQFSILPS